MSNIGDRTHRAVNGALQSCIDSHGPIDEHWVDSATKRIVAQLRSTAEQSYVYGTEEGDKRPAIDAVYKRMEKLRYGHRLLVQQHAALQAKYDDAVQRADAAEERVRGLRQILHDHIDSQPTAVEFVAMVAERLKAEHTTEAVS